MPKPNIHAGHRERVKAEFREKGLDHFADYKILELLLYYSVSRRDTNPIGHGLMERFGSFSGVFEAPAALLEEVEGIGRESATLIKLVSAIIRRYMADHTSQGNSIRSCVDAKDYISPKFLCEPNECAYIICLGSNGKVILCRQIGEGSGKTVNISPSEIVRAALRSGAVRVVLAHNHPNGICNPSSRDLRTTSIIYDELKRVDVELFDHIIVAPDGVYSMVENNMFPASR